MQFRNLTIIGTSHIAAQSVQRIRKAFEEQVDVVAIELDAPRLHALLHPGEQKVGFRDLARHVGMRGALFAVIARFAQQKLGDKVGLAPGADMKAAYELAIQHNAKVALIDRPLEQTLRRFSKFVTFREKMRMGWDVAMGMMGKDELGRVKIDLRKVPESKLIRSLLGKVKERYPRTYQVLVAERDEFMAHRLRHLMAAFPTQRIVAVVGAGHEDGILELLRREDEGVRVAWSVSQHPNI